MIGRLARWQLVAFIIVTILVVLTTGIYTGMPSALGFGRYTIFVELPRAGMLYPRALATLGGTPIGNVRDVFLTSSGVKAEVSVERGVAIPSNAEISIRSVSAIGEQYLNFTPRDSPSAPLEPEAIVQATGLTMPVDVNHLLDSANRLVSTLPKNDLRNAIDGLSDAFSGSSENFGNLLDASDHLVDVAQANIVPTQHLIDDLQPVLDTQSAVGSDILMISKNLAYFSDRLRKSDAQLRGAIERTPVFTSGLDGLIERLRDPLPRLLTGLNDVGQVANIYLPNVRHTIIVLPALLNGVESSLFNTPIPNTLRINFKATVGDPPPCTQGFVGSQQRNPADLRPVLPEVDAFCKVPQNSPQDTRGTRNSPCPNNPLLRSPDAAGCGLSFQNSDESRGALARALATIMEGAARNPTTAPQPPDAPPADAGVSVESTPAPGTPGN